MPKAIHRIRRGSPVALEQDRDKRDPEADYAGSDKYQRTSTHTI